MQDANLWGQQVSLVFARLDEQQRRLVAGLLSKKVGWGGDTEMALVTGLDPKTIRRGRNELDNDLKDCPSDRIRCHGAGRPRVEKKIPISSRG